MRAPRSRESPTKEFQAKLLAKGEGLVDKLKARGGYWIG